MSNNVRIELDSAGIQDLLKSPEIQSELEMYARDMNVLYDGIEIYAKRAAIHGNKGDKNVNREND